MGEETVLLKKRGDLSKIGLIPKMFNQDRYDPKGQGEYEGEYRGTTLLGSRGNITPIFDRLTNRWAFEGSTLDLATIQNKLKLRDSKGDIIPITEDTLFNKVDPFWAHPDLWNIRDLDIVEGSTALSTDNPLQELMMRVYRGSNAVVQEGKKQSKFNLLDAEYSLISPKQEEQKQVKDIDRNLKASTLLMAMGEERQKAILAIMNPPTYNIIEIDPTRMKNTLYNECAMDTAPNKRYGGMSSQEKFIQLAELPDELLTNMSMIMKAVLLGHITPNHKTGYTFKGELLDSGHIKSDAQLTDFLLDRENSEVYFEIVELVKNS